MPTITAAADVMDEHTSSSPEEATDAPEAKRAARRRGFRMRPLLTVAIGAVLIALVLWRFGGGPILLALRSLRWSLIAAAIGIGSITTIAAAVRWRVIARVLAVPVSVGETIRAYFAAQFLNVTVPGGVVGDIHRGLSHGWDRRSRLASLRAVVWDRSCGQLMQIVIAVGAVIAVSWSLPVARPLAQVVLAVVAGSIVLAWLVRYVIRRFRQPRASAGTARWGRLRRAWHVIVGDWSGIVADRRALVTIVVTSIVTVAGPVTIFVASAVATGLGRAGILLLPIALIVMTVAAIPFNVAGWGPREGAAVAVFALVGLPAADGVAASFVFGILLIVSTLPGAVALLIRPRRGSARAVPAPL